MQNLLNFDIEPNGVLSTAVLAAGFSSFESFAKYVRSLPYGRIEPSNDGLAVLREKRGTCSSKHQLLALLAHECGHTEISLTIGIYEMSEENTPGVGATLSTKSLRSLPEAHCYLTARGKRFDFTGLASGELSPFDALLHEYTVPPEQLAKMKTKIHQQFISAWSATRGVSAEHVWALREACIANLAANDRKQRDCRR